jgi:WD40 repeat protein/serine/threonine protein kinase
MEKNLLTARAIFDHALEIDSPVERKAYLDQACADAPEVKQKVESLLEAYEAAGSFLESPPQGSEATIDHPSRSLNEGPGTKIGPYKLLQKLGEGGMGVVYMAEQEEPVRRRVALKIIKPGMDSREVIARFEAERQALALMDHQNIARILDAGMTATGRPFFVMELVHGVPITKYCDDHHLTPRERLELIVPVCQAIHHAHQKGVIHRDIKPSNVMVCLYDGKPVPKIIDFGVAKAIGQRLTERTMFTQYGAIVGSLEYMSPEQAEMSQLGVDTRSDIYLLGVLMYELLTGDTPLRRQRLKEVAFDEVLRLIREEEPPRPSTRLSGSGPALVAISAQRHMEPAKLTKLLRGELDWIAMKALEKDRTRRYDSASAMAKDIERFLMDEPVEACPPSTLYRLRKLARRHKTAVAVSAVMASTIALFIFLQSHQVIQANRAREDAELAREEEKKAKNAAQTLAEEKEQTAEDLAKALASANKAKSEAEEARKAEAKEKNIAMAMAMAQVEATRSAAQAYLKLKQVSDELSRNLYFSRIALADREFFSNNVARARDSLDKCPPEQRHWEWHYLNRLCRRELLTLAHPGKVMSAAFSPDGQLLATGGGEYKASGELKVWDTRTGKELFNLSGHASPVNSVAFSPGGKQLVSASLDKTIKFWDPATGKELKNLEAPAELMQIAFSPDGAWMATALGDKTVRLWNATTDEQLGTLSNLKLLTGLAFSPDSKQLAVVDSDNKIKLHDIATSEEKIIELGDHRGFFPRLAFSADGQQLVAAAYHAVVTYDLQASRVVATIPGSQLDADNVFVNADGRRLAAAGHDKSIQLWDAQSITRLATFRGHDSNVTSVTFSLDGTRLASTSFDKTVRVWDVTGDPEVRFLPIAKAPSFAVAFSPDGQHLAVGRAVDLQNVQFQNQAHVLLVDVKTGKEIRKFGSTLLPFASVGFSPDGKQLVAVTNSFPAGAGAEKAAGFGVGPGSLYVWDLNSGMEILTHTADFGVSPRLSVSQDRQRPLVAVAKGYSGQGELKVWDLATREIIRTIPETTNCVAFSGKDDLLAAGGGEFGKPGVVKIWNAITGAELHTLREHGDAVLAVAFNPGVPELASGGMDRFVRIFDTRSGKTLHTLGTHPHQINSLAFSPDGRRLAVGGGNVVRLWDAQSGTEALTLPQPPGNVLIVNLAFSPDSRTIAAADANGSVILWESPTLSPMQPTEPSIGDKH